MRSTQSVLSRSPDGSLEKAAIASLSRIPRQTGHDRLLKTGRPDTPKAREPLLTPRESRKPSAAPKVPPEQEQHFDFTLKIQEMVAEEGLEPPTRGL